MRFPTHSLFPLMKVLSLSASFVPATVAVAGLVSVFAFLRSANLPSTLLPVPGNPVSEMRVNPAAAPADSNQLYLPDDLEATLWAESPLFHNPTNVDVDGRGRLWVTEAVNYRNFNNKPDSILHHAPGDRVVILEDSDGDGKADRTKVFVQDKDLVSPLGIAVIGNKVIVSCAPHLIVYTDADGDDKPDNKEILLTGFGGLDHDHSLHALVAGPDGDWYFNTGNAGPHVVTDKAGWTLRSGSLYTGGTPHSEKNTGNLKSDDGRVWVGGLALRITPEGKGLEVMGHNFRNSYETALDSYGNLWQNDNDDQVITCRTSWLMEGANMGYFSADGTRYWQADRRPGQEMFTAHWHQEDPGVLPAGDNTGAGSPTGVLFYEGDALGPQYRGTLLSAEAGRNVIFSYQPQPQGAGFRLDRKTLASSLPVHEENYFWNQTGADRRKWFRPSDVAAGTDGALYIADWYDPIVGGHLMHDKQGYGRIYRVTPKGKKLPPPVLDLRTTDGQVQALLSPAVNVRNAGFVRLKARGSKAVKPLQKVLASENPYHRARAAWLLAQLGAKGEAVVAGLLRSPDAHVRLTAFRALRKVQPDVLPLAGQLAADPSPAVRREVAIALRDVPYEKCKTIIGTLVQGYDGEDRYYLEALGLALDGKEDAYFADQQSRLPADPTSWDAPTASLLWRLHPAGAAEAFARRADAEGLSDADRRQALVALGFMKDKRAAGAMVALTKSKRADVAGQALWWVNFRKSNDWLDVLDWEEAIAGQFSARGQQVLKLRAVVTDAKRSAADRVAAALDLARDADGGRMLVSLAAEGSLPKEIRDTVQHHIFNNPDQSVRVMASDYFRRDRNVSYPIGLITKLQATPGNGQKLFATHCTTCHRHGAEGNEVGPDLTRIGGKFDKPGLLDAIINPSAGLAFGYEPWLITTKKGTSYYGFLVSDAQAVVVKDVAGAQHVIRREEIATRKQMTTSLMPDPAALGLKEQDLADLAAYLMEK